MENDMHVFLDLNNAPHSYDKICLFNMGEVPSELRPFLNDIMEVLNKASVTKNILVGVRNDDGQMESAIWIFESTSVRMYYDRVQVFLKAKNIPFIPGAPPLKDVMGFKFPM